jgi:nucleoside-diphosphate-sugar epimerase
MLDEGLGKCFVSGGTGFIGQRLTSFLIHSRHDIRLLSRNLHSSIETIVCDLQIDPVPDDALVGIDTVFHLAGFAHDLREATKIEHLYQKINVDSTVKLAELAVKSKVKRFVFVSSVKAGGSTIPGTCMAESDQHDPEGVYGRTKREAEIKLLEIGRRSGMHVSIVRPSLVYGPGVKGNLSMMLSGIEKGWFPPLPETGNHRSMIHVDDLVRAILLVAGNDLANGEIFIANDGQSYSSREIYEAMCVALGKPIPRWNIPKFLFNMTFFMSYNLRYKLEKLLGDECYSSEKLQSLGFKPHYSLNEINETSF